MPKAIDKTKLINHVFKKQSEEYYFAINFSNDGKQVEAAIHRARYEILKELADDILEGKFD